MHARERPSPFPDGHTPYIRWAFIDSAASSGVMDSTENSSSLLYFDDRKSLGRISIASDNTPERKVVAMRFGDVRRRRVISIV